MNTTLPKSRDKQAASHASSIACCTSFFSIGRKALIAATALLLCLGLVPVSPAFAAIYDGGASTGNPIEEIPLPDEGDSFDGENDAPDDLIVLRSLDYPDRILLACAVPVGITVDGLIESEQLEVAVLASTEEVFTNADQEDRVKLDLNWDFSTLDTSKTGYDELIAHAELPAGYCWADGSTQLSFIKPISVQNPNRPVLDVHYSASWHVMFPWVEPTEFEETAIQAYLATGTGDWKNLEEEDLGLVENHGLAIFSDALSSGETYRIRIEYPRGYAEAGFLFDAGNALIIDTVSGDRDGGDGDGDGPADGVQPSPNNPSDTAPPAANGSENEGATDQGAGQNANQPNSESSGNDASSASATGQTTANGNSTASTSQGAIERYNARETTVSGTRLNDLQAASDVVPFDQNGVVVSLPSTFLASLNLGASDTLSVYAMKIGNDRVAVALTVNGRALSNTPGMTVRAPYNRQEQDAPFNILDETGAMVAQGTFAGTALTFATDKPGTFRIVEGDLPVSEKTSEGAIAKSKEEPAGLAYGAGTGSADVQSGDGGASTMSLALTLFLIGILAAAGGCSMVAFLKRRS